MKEDLIEELQSASEKVEPMTPRTIRLPKKLDEEIRDFCGKNQIRFSVIARRIFREGWKALNSESSG